MCTVCPTRLHILEGFAPGLFRLHILSISGVLMPFPAGVTTEMGCRGCTLFAAGVADSARRAATLVSIKHEWCHRAAHTPLQAVLVTAAGCRACNSLALTVPAAPAPQAWRAPDQAPAWQPAACRPSSNQQQACARRRSASAESAWQTEMLPRPSILHGGHILLGTLSVDRPLASEIIGATNADLLKVCSRTT